MVPLETSIVIVIVTIFIEHLLGVRHYVNRLCFNYFTTILQIRDCYSHFIDEEFKA